MAGIGLRNRAINEEIEDQLENIEPSFNREHDNTNIQKPSPDRVKQESAAVRMVGKPASLNYNSVQSSRRQPNITIMSPKSNYHLQLA